MTRFLTVAFAALALAACQQQPAVAPEKKAAAPAAPASPGPASDASYSATDANAGNPADVASARVAESADTIESRLSCSVASRDKSRKLIRDVATRDPYGRTTASRSWSDPRMRAAADVISSSISR